mmetsp:Transcript_19416/g.56588  ORF Transcript_19416/g.56588 Transcript_19416/m.56588 type:complete len:214 (-) Transcript_19416:311-952(-)
MKRRWATAGKTRVFLSKSMIQPGRDLPTRSAVLKKKTRSTGSQSPRPLWLWREVVRPGKHARHTTKLLKTMHAGSRTFFNTAPNRGWTSSAFFWLPSKWEFSVLRGAPPAPFSTSFGAWLCTGAWTARRRSSYSPNLRWAKGVRSSMHHRTMERTTRQFEKTKKIFVDAVRPSGVAGSIALAKILAKMMATPPMPLPASKAFMNSGPSWPPAP